MFIKLETEVYATGNWCNKQA